MTTLMAWWSRLRAKKLYLRLGTTLVSKLRMTTLMTDWKKASTARLTIIQRRDRSQKDQLVKLW